MVSISVDLRSKFGPARNQGSRPTCIAFATSDLHAASRSAKFIALSTEFLFYHSVQRSPMKNPAKGVSLSAIGTTLKQEGQPIETDWPYLSVLPNPLSAWKPPSGLTVFKQ